MRRLKLRNAALGLMILILACTLSCGGQEQASAPAAQQKPEKGDLAPKDKEAGEEEAKTATSAAQEARALDMEKREWHYEATDKWDPFLIPPPPVNTQPSSERYDLDQMTLFGVIRGSGMDAAYVRLPDGTDKIIRIGDILGKHGGEVKKINKESIVVEEKYMDPKRPNDTFIIEKELKLVEAKKK
jgi:Tfp pilus assembly protein PilP